MNKRRYGTILCSIALIGLIIMGCSNKEQAVSKPEVKQQSESSKVSKEKTQEELNTEIKSKAQRVEFVKINGHEADFKTKEVYVEGDITAVTEDAVLPTFTVTSKEGDGFGMYEVVNLFKENVKKGDKVKVYGKISGEKSSLGMPMLSGNIIEKK